MREILESPEKKLAADIAGAMRGLWGKPGKRRMLARIATHERQFEAWWKFELASHLWALYDTTSLSTFVEAFDRADVVLGIEHDNRLVRSAPTCVPIELKTVGTFWGPTANKAFSETGKKRLEREMEQIDERGGKPFAMLALLITHAGEPDARLPSYVALARALGEKHGLQVLVDDELSLPAPAKGLKASAHQLVWISPG